MDEALVTAVDRVGDRWSLLICEALRTGPMRFSDLQTAVEGIAPNTLSSRLTSLEEVGVVVATPYQRRPERYSYELTAAGLELVPVLIALRAWGGARGAGDPPTHEVCGTELEIRWFCPSCQYVVVDPDGDVTYV